jgi:small subunit ribosomal protein S8
MMTDPIADMLNRIKNAYAVRADDLRLPSSKLKESIAKVLAERGFIAGYSLEPEPRPTLVIVLRYEGGKPALSHVRRLSRPGQRRYVAAREIPRVRGGQGTVIVSTSGGLKTGEAARREGVGGELLCEVY